MAGTLGPVFLRLIVTLTKKERHDWMALNIARGLSEQVKAIRLDRGWSQEELSRRSGVNQARISYIERWWSLKVTINTLLRLAQAFDVALAARFTDWIEFLLGLAPQRAVKPFDANALT